MSEENKIESIYMKIARIQFGVGKIYKDAKNKYLSDKGSSEVRYETIEGILDALNPLLQEEGCALYSNVQLLNDNYVLYTTINDGIDEFSVMCPLQASGNNMMQAYGSALSYARRYNLRNLFNLSTTDDDGESSASRETKITTVKPKQKPGGYIIPKECRAFAGKKITEVSKDQLAEYIKGIKAQVESKGASFPEWFIKLDSEFKKLGE